MTDTTKPTEKPAGPQLVINATQLRSALELVAPDFDTDEDQREADVCIQYLPARMSTDGEPMEAGLYCWLAEYPEEGCIPLRPDEKFPSPSVHRQASAGQEGVTDELQELHNELYRAQTTDSPDVLTRAIGKARLLLSRYRESLTLSAHGAMPHVFLQSVRHLCFVARTSGGTAGRDEDLCRALEVVEQMMQGAAQPAPVRKKQEMDDATCDRLIYAVLLKLDSFQWSKTTADTRDAVRAALSTAAPESKTAIEWPDPGELESWRATADDLLREMHSPRSFTIRRAAHLLQNAYMFASKAAPTAGETL